MEQIYTGLCAAVCEEMAVWLLWVALCLLELHYFLPDFLFLSLLPSRPLPFFLPSFFSSLPPFFHLFLPPLFLHLFFLPASLPLSLSLSFSRLLCLSLSEIFRNIFCLVQSPTWGNGWLVETDKKHTVLHDLGSFDSRTQHNDSWRNERQNSFSYSSKGEVSGRAT